MKEKTEINIFEHPAIVYWRAIMTGDLETAGTIDSGLDQIEFMELQRNFFRLIALSDELLLLDRHIKGHSKEGLNPFIKDLLKEGVTIPLELMRRIYAPGIQAGTCKDPVEEMEKHKIAGRLRALADVKKERGKIGKCNESIRLLAMGNRGDGDCHTEVDELLKSGTAKRIRYFDTMTFKKCFSTDEVKALLFPKTPKEYRKLGEQLIQHRQKWSINNGPESLKDYYDSLKAGGCDFKAVSGE